MGNAVTEQGADSDYLQLDTEMVLGKEVRGHARRMDTVPVTRRPGPTISVLQLEQFRGFVLVSLNASFSTFNFS